MQLTKILHCYDVVTTAGLVLTDAEANTAADPIDKFLLYYNVLAKRAHTDGFRLYGFTPKFHWLWHIGLFFQILESPCGLVLPIRGFHRSHPTLCGFVPSKNADVESRNEKYVELY